MDDSKKTAAKQGSFEQWNDIWNEFAGEGHEMKRLFTRGKPSTIYQFWQLAYFEDFIELIGHDLSGKFLELGSGRGTTSLYLANAGVSDITLVDLSEQALSQAAQNFAFEELPAPKTVLENAEDTKLPSDSFDYVYNIGVLEHFEDPTAILNEAFRILRPGGQIFMPIVPQMPFYKSLICRALFNPLSIAKQIVKKVIQRKSKSRISEMIRTKNGRLEYSEFSNSVGFSDIKCVPYNPYWKTNRDDSFVLNSIALPLYKIHYHAKKIAGLKPFLKTFDFSACCYLLTASKH